MRLHMFAVFDSKVGVYASPFFCRSKGEALRSFEDACGDKGLPFGKHPGDYRLWYLGEFDDNTGVIYAAELIALCGASDFVVTPTNGGGAQIVADR